MKTIILNQTTFKMSASCRGAFRGVWDGDTSNHYKFIVTIITDLGKTSFTFFDSYYNWEKGKTELNEDDLKGALECFLSDASAYNGAADLRDFCDNFGYDYYDYNGRRKANKIYKACKRSHDAASRIFNDYYGIINAINE